MASPIFTTLFMSTILFSFSSQNIVAGTNIGKSLSLIGDICSNSMDPTLCAKFIQSQPRIIATKNLHDVAINLLEFGASDVKNTLNHVKKSLNNPGIAPNMKTALVECTKAYDTVIATYASAIKEVKNGNTFEGTATYDLQVGCFDFMQPCIDAVAAAKINDPTILNGNNIVHQIGSYAASAIGKL